MCDVHGLCASSPAKRRLFAQSHLHPDLLHFRFLSSPALTLDGLAKISALLAATRLIRKWHVVAERKRMPLNSLRAVVLVAMIGNAIIARRARFTRKEERLSV